MNTTTSFSTACRTDIPLVYRCEHCGKEVRMSYPLRTEYAVAAPGSAAQNQALKSQFEQTAQDTLLAKQQQEVAELDESFNTNRQYWRLDGFISAGKCPYCKKQQTWHRLVPGGEGKSAGAWIGALAGFALGVAVVGVGRAVFHAIENLAAAAILAVCVAAGVIVGKAQGKRSGTAKKTKFEAWLKSAPEAQIPRLLTEQRSPSRFIDAGLRGMYDMK